MPCTKKLDKILFYSVSKECFADYVDVDTVVMSMLFDRNLKVPDAESAVQIPNRAKTKSHNPFDASKAKMKDRAESPDRPAPQQCWDPVLPVESRIVDGSALSLVRQQVPARLSPTPPHPPFSLHRWLQPQLSASAQTIAPIYRFRRHLLSRNSI